MATRLQIAQVIAQSPGRHLPTLFFYLSLVIFLALVIIVVAVVVRKRLGRDDPSGHAPFTLSDLRALHAKGQVSDEEYERMKAGLLARYHSAADASDGLEEDPGRASRS